MNNNYRYRPSFYNSTIGTPINKIILETSSSYDNLSPVYLFNLDVDTRKFLYYGKMNVPRIGIHHGILTSLANGMLVELIESSYFFRMNTEYLSGEPYLSKTKLTVILKNGIQKTVIFDDFVRPIILIV